MASYCYRDRHISEWNRKETPERDSWIYQTWYIPRGHFSSVQSLSHVQLFATPWTAARRASLSIINSQSLLKLISIESVMPSNRLILCHPLLLSPSIFPRIRVFCNESVLHIGGQVLEFQLQHQSFWWIFRTDFLWDWLVWSLCNPRDSSRVFSNTTVQKHQFFGPQLSLWSNSQIHTWITGKKT